ncbi:Rv3235 family protein [Actinokineospora alba]|uniref:Rv3235 family protein n=1 Tax=Actinokineospora alba TaxID=504798 RepID=UPI00105D2BCE|nr:Rv3235 family protein [Actinokineospora alba]
MRISALAEYEPPLCGEAEENRWITPAPRLVSVVAVPSPTPGLGREALGRMFGLVLEALDGRRPVAQLRGTMSAGVYEAMVTRVRSSSGWTHRLASLRSCAVSESVVEVSATVRVFRRGAPWRAVAVVGRVELREEGWVFTYLRVITPASSAGRRSG